MNRQQAAKIPIVVHETHDFGIIDPIQAHNAIMEYYEETGVLPSVGDLIVNEAKSLQFQIRGRKLYPDCIELVIE